MLLDQQQVPPISEFPILLSKGLIDGKFLPGILFPMSRGRYDDNLIMQSIVLNGVMFDCFVTRTRAIPEEVLEFSLQPTGRVLIPSRSYENLGINIDEFSKKMKSTCVKSFYQKHA